MPQSVRCGRTWICGVVCAEHETCHLRPVWTGGELGFDCLEAKKRQESYRVGDLDLGEVGGGGDGGQGGVARAALFRVGG